ncbi:hypothetical protein [Nocardia jejuensis]|uniref:hypothetical protein n=1 Tax=Nocardia jejuensis TaxID=328049 RepID=UPI0008367452|nr:hypothetical protein [Nocardia jejuensis]
MTDKSTTDHSETASAPIELVKSDPGTPPSDTAATDTPSEPARAEVLDDSDATGRAAAAAASDPSAASTDPGSPSRIRGAGAWLRGHAVVVGAVAVCLVAAGVTTHFVLRAGDLTDREDARAEALQAACAYAPVLATYDAKDIDGYFRTVLAGATGNWKEEFDSTSKDLREVLIQGQVTSKATDVQCGIQSFAPGTAKALVAINQTITSAGTSGQPRAGQLTVGLTLKQTEGRWLVDKVDSPQIPKPATSPK